MNNLPNVSFVGRSVSRREDQRLLTGRGQFIADLKLPQMLHAVFIRSPVAHARINAIDLSRAAAMPGIIYALSGPELARQLPPVPDTQLTLPSKWTTLVQHKFIGATLTTFGQGPPWEKRTMITIETPILLMLGVLAIGTAVWALSS